MRIPDSTRLPPDSLIDGNYIDSDLGIVNRTRRYMVADGRLPSPVGFISGRARWRYGDYLAPRERAHTGPKRLKAYAVLTVLKRDPPPSLRRVLEVIRALRANSGATR